MVVWIQNPFDNLPGEGYRKQRYWMMAEAFVRAGHRVLYWTSDFSHATKAPRRFCAQMDLFTAFDLRLVPTPPYWRNVGLARLKSHAAYAAAWRRAALEDGLERPDVIVSSLPTISAAETALDLARHFGARSVIDVQDAWPETFERLVPRAFGALTRLVLRPAAARARRIYREADLVTGVSARYRALTGRDEYHLAYLGIELDAGNDSRWRRPYREVTRLVYSGNLGRTYDLATLVRAVEENEDLELDIAGFGEFRCEAPRVRCHGFLSAPDLAALYDECDIGVIPMADASWVGLPNKIFDYARAGLGIVSSLTGESAALLESYRCGATYRPGDVASLVAAIRRVAMLEGGASRKLCEREFDARLIYDEYVRRVCHD